MANESESKDTADRETPSDSHREHFLRMAAKRQPSFVLLAQDLTADLVVDFWTIVQVRVESAMAQGRTVAEAMTEVRNAFGIANYLPIWSTEKLNGATRIAGEMRQWPNRKLAD